MLKGGYIKFFWESKQGIEWTYLLVFLILLPRLGDLRWRFQQVPHLAEESLALLFRQGRLEELIYELQELASDSQCVGRRRWDRWWRA